ncbi:MAG TPA: CPBP family intramembrane glutamic endopeptidase [Propylenella sp.]|nr:CPBP family intramembrane glutamic endopeptidase [Propylenella sp.]
MQPGGHPVAFARAAVALTALGSLGILVLIPITAWQVADIPGLPVPPITLAAIAAIQPFILLVLGALAGAFAAPRLGLGSVLAERASGVGTGPEVLRGLGWIVFVSVLLGAAINLVDELAQPLWVPAGVQWLSTAETWSPVAFVFGILYGGLTEEVIFRWGLMSVAAWALWRLSGSAKAPPRWTFVAAIAVSALIFGAGHLPALAGMMPLSPGPIIRTVVLNAVAGTWLGWLFWRRHLEAAMLGHAAVHVGFAAYAVPMIVWT